MSGFPDSARRWVPPTAVAAFTALGVAAQGMDGLRLCAAAVVLVALVPLVARTSPAVSFGAAAAAVAGLAVICNGSAANVGWFGVVVISGWLAIVSPVAVWVTVWVGALAVLAGEAIATSDRGWINWLAGTTFAAVACWLGRRERDLSDRLRAAQAGLAERVRADERGRIAREIHDVVAHSLTVSLLHISGARLALADGDRDEATRMLADAERTGRSALAEVRQAVGMLRDYTASGTTPTPDARAIVALVDAVRAAGASVELTVEGSLDDLPATTGLALYRIVQEAVTNAVRHAPAATTRIRIVGDRDAVSLEAATSPVAPAAARTGGTGLAGMQERAAALGGTCTSGAEGGAWRVRAHLPVRREPAEGVLR